MSMDEVDMTTLTIRNIDAALKARLLVRAARNGRSMESELRHILNDTLAADREARSDLAEAIQRRFAPFGGVDLEPHPPVEMAPPPNFER